MSNEAEYTITENEYVQANRLFSRLRRKQIFVFSSILLALALLALFANDYRVQAMSIGGLIGGIGVYLVIRFLIAPWRTRKLYRSYPAVRDPCTIIVEEGGVRFRSKNGEALLEWSHIIRWRADEHSVLIYQAPHLYHLVPKRLEAVCRLLEQALLRHVGEAS